MKKKTILYKETLPSPYQNLCLNKPKSALEDAENVFKFLFTDEKFSRAAMSNRLFKALFQKKDLGLLRIGFYELQRLLLSFFKTRQDATDELLSIVVGWILALLPFFEPPDGLHIFLPVKREKGWQLCDYEIEHINLTPSYLGSSILALGLKPQDGTEPLFLFMGTPQPTATGNFLSLWTDFVPGYCVGELVYKLFAQKKVRQWLDATYKKYNQKVKLYGKSLGGALSLLTLMDNAEKISEVHVYCPALPLSAHKTSSQYKPKVFLYFRERDPVYYVGTSIEPDWQLNRIETEVKQNYFFAHLRVCPCFSGVSITPLDPEVERKKVIRKILTLGHFLVSIPIFVLLTAYLACRALVRTVSSSSSR